MRDRTRAILRCCFYAILPPPLEWLWRGYIHYLPREGQVVDVLIDPMTYLRWVGHGIINLEDAMMLLSRPVLTEEDREFHKIRDDS